MENFKPEISDEMLKSKAYAWSERYDEELDSFKERDIFSAEELANLVWNRGILDHISPTDSEEIRARKALKKDTWDRNDSELYWRILYATGYLKDAIPRNLTMVSGYAAGPILKAAHRCYKPENKYTNFLTDLADEIILRAN